MEKQVVTCHFKSKGKIQISSEIHNRRKQNINQKKQDKMQLKNLYLTVFKFNKSSLFVNNITAVLRTTYVVPQ